MRLARSADDAVTAAESVGFPVALKPSDLRCCTRRNGRRCGLTLPMRTPCVMRQKSSSNGFVELAGLLVQRMVPGGIEMLVGAVHDTTFGPLIACGTGGILVDLLKDTVFRLHPITSEDAVDMINELKGVQLLRGYRGAPPVDDEALRGVILRVSALVTSVEKSTNSI